MNGLIAKSDCDLFNTYDRHHHVFHHDQLQIPSKGTPKVPNYTHTLNFKPIQRRVYVGTYLVFNEHLKLSNQQTGGGSPGSPEERHEARSGQGGGGGDEGLHETGLPGAHPHVSLHARQRPRKYVPQQVRPGAEATGQPRQQQGKVNRSSEDAFGCHVDANPEISASLPLVSFRRR